MNNKKSSLLVLVLVSFVAVLSITLMHSPSNSGYTIKPILDIKKEAAQDQQDYAYSRIGYAQGYPKRTVKKDVAHVPSLIPRVERIEATPFRGLDRTGKPYMSSKREIKAGWTRRMQKVVDEYRQVARSRINAG